ncbi:MAG TPA: HAMP domain-containing sensor histidine kinase [Micropepsaceae bacterium]|nr:HAMP domain-containing sensor histidine kinase [Micropepsaceae bacterium]
MFERCKTDLAAFWARGIKSLLRLPSIIIASLSPATEQDALRIEAELDLVREGIRLFDYAYPLLGLVIGTIVSHHAPLANVVGSWLFIVATSVTNEILLSRRTRVTNVIAHARARARMMSVMTLVQTLGWASLILWAWDTNSIPSNMFAVLVVSCTLAGISMRLSPHAAAVAGPMAFLSSLMFVMEAFHSTTYLVTLFQLAIVYTVLMLFQACATHNRFYRTWQLERDRDLLIENLHQAKRESDRAHRQALIASKTKSEFLANMSHELRTPLNAIIGFSDIVRSRTFGDAPERYSEYGGFINQSGQHLLRMIGDILELAKIDAGRKKLQPEPIDLMSLVRDEVYLAGEKAAEKTIAVDAHLPPSLPLLHADLHAVRQILANLLSNAVKFTPPNGRVDVSVTLNAGHEIELTVADNGVGIANEIQAQLFERFGQESPEVTTASRGSGLGLPIVKGLVEMHGGRIRLRSELGEGTRITIVFPRASTLDGAALNAA